MLILYEISMGQLAGSKKFNNTVAVLQRFVHIKKVMKKKDLSVFNF